MKHGANIYKYAKKLNCSSDEIVDFSSNINLYNPKTNIKLTNTMLVNYADNSYSKLKKTISKYYHIKTSQIALYNGASSAIFELFKSLKQKRVYLYAPLYGEYEKAVQKDVKIIKINRFKSLHVEPKKNSIVVFVNPSTPDGRYYDLEKLFKLWKRKNCTVVLDESFLEFEGLKSLRNQINNYKKLYIIQSFSKFNSCAGVRIGAIFSHKSNIKKLKLPLWNISSFDALFLRKRLKDKEFRNKSKALHVEQKKELYRILKGSKLFSKIYKSDSNFFLTKTKKSKQIFKKLLKKKILVRTCDSFDFLGKNHLRFGVKCTNKHKKLKRGLNGLC
jgi:threonine-phosphate decarboxylase